MKNSFGSSVTITVFGESHGPAVGVVLDGLAPGVPLDMDFIAAEMEKRRAKDALSTPRQEKDRVEILSGTYAGYTTGAPVCVIIRNENVRSGDYLRTAKLARPGHADFTAHEKYLGYADPRGGGHFSARVTAPIVAAGAICRTILASHGILLGTHIAQCADVTDKPLPEEESELRDSLQMLNHEHFPVISPTAAERMREVILDAKTRDDSVGGVLETAIVGLPAGVGEPFFHSVESVLAGLLYSVPAVKGVEFGLGFGFAHLPGSEANDPFVMKNGHVQTETNHNGGVNGGISNGMPITIRCAFKPTPSIAKPQRTVNLDEMENTTLELTGRHDPSVLTRARAVVDAVCAIGLVDLCSQRWGTLWQCEKFVDKADK